MGRPLTPGRLPAGWRARVHCECRHRPMAGTACGMCRVDGCCMDPASGEEGPSFPALCGQLSPVLREAGVALVTGNRR